MTEDLRMFGIQWHVGSARVGAVVPYTKSERFHLYRAVLEKLKAREFIYPCTCSRKDVLNALSAPHETEAEPIYPGTCRSNRQSQIVNRKFNWRFRVRDNEAISFVDGRFGPQHFVAGKDFGDFVVWRHDGVPA